MKGLETKPNELIKGDIVDSGYMYWYFNLIPPSHCLGVLSSHYVYDDLLFHHTLKGFEVIDDNYTRIKC